MSQRYSRADKGKWVTSSTQQERDRPPVKIPPSDNAHLIEANKRTLIGRVTNPAIQKPIQVIDWLIQYWNLERRVTGRALGPEIFQFRFESEEDLLYVLRKGPYHYKRWMVMLQRWEPVVSNSFPNMIPFWIRIHGLPLHYWTKAAVAAIGKELGSFLDEDVEHGRVRVHVNGLENLEMGLPLELPSGEIVSVDLEYEKLEKHCFLCFSLRHEKANCPLDGEKAKIASPPRGISQQNTIRSLEDHKKRRDRRLPHCQLSPQAQSRHSSQYIPHSDNRRSPSHRRSNEECRPNKSVHFSQSSRTRPATHAQVEPTVELERALALLGFVDT